MQPSQRVIRALWDLEKPVLAGVNGVAAGLGAHLAYACDLVIASDEARFIEVFVRRGIALDAGGGFLLPRHLGLHKAKELVFLGDELSAADAERLGLVNKVVPAAELENELRAWAKRLAAGPIVRHRALEAPAEPLAAGRHGHALRGGGVHAGAGRQQRGHARGNPLVHGEAASRVQGTLIDPRTCLSIATSSFAGSS